MAYRLALVLPLLLTVLPNAAVAQLADPTRPPVRTSGSTAETVSAEVSGSGLQSVIMRKGGRPAALINGEVVELGGKLGEARLVKVDEDSVVLLGPAGRETLRLMPTAEKKMKAVAAQKSIGLNAYKGEAEK